MAVHPHHHEPMLPRQPWVKAFTRDDWEPKGESAGQMASPMFGRPPYWATGSKRQCVGTTGPGFRCQLGSLWLMPDADFCAHHLPHDLMPTLIARRDLWVALATDLWREIMAEYPALIDGGGAQS